MDYQPGGSLAQYITALEPQESVSREKTARDITEQILQGVFVLHQNGIMHRDIKPEVCPPVFHFLQSHLSLTY